MRAFFTLILSTLVTSSVLAQIPNYSFEIWDSSAGYRMPANWDNLNPVTHSTATYTCTYDSPGSLGAYFMKLTSKNIPGMGMMGGIAVCGKLDSVTHKPACGFPYTSRPEVLAGEWQYMGFAITDQGYVSVLLSKWNSGTSTRDTVAFTRYVLPDMAMIWTPFHIPLNYYTSDTPDSAMIVLSSSGGTLAPPFENSYLWVDNLRLTDSATLSAGYSLMPQQTLLYPNPAKKQFTISYYSSTGSDATVSITDVTGRVVTSFSRSLRSGSNKIIVDNPELTKGLYFVRISERENAVEKKLIIE